MDSLNFVSAMRGLILDHLLEMHTTVPARVSGVDYSSKTVTASAIVKNTRSSTDSQDYPIFYDVPIMVNGGGTGRITFPIISGDMGVLVFSERDPSNALQTDGSDASSSSMVMPCGLYPIMFVPKIALGGDSTPDIDSENVVIDNNQQTSISLSPDGTGIIKSELGGSITVDDGVTISDGSGTFTVRDGKANWTGGEFTINGLTISEEGLIRDSSGVGLDTHDHQVKGIESGDSTVTTEKGTG